MADQPAGSLTVVGTGIKLVAEVTAAGQAAIREADKVYFVAGDPVKATWLTRLNPSAESLHTLYTPGKSRRTTYQEMVEIILAAVRRGLTVCAVFYGHPGVFVSPSHRAIQQARREGYPAEMLPGISAENCLFADLALDPTATGYQRFEATSFLLYRRLFDPTCALVLWQIRAIGQPTFQPENPNRPGLQLLADTLRETYPPTHEVILYEAAQYAVIKPVIRRLPLAELPRAEVSLISTLYVPALAAPRPDPDMLKKLGLEQSGQK